MRASGLSVPPWLVGAVVALVGTIVAVLAVDSRYAKEDELAAHVRTAEERAAQHLTRGELDERLRFVNEQSRVTNVQQDERFTALADQVKRLADLQEAHQRLPMHTGTAEALARFDSRFAAFEANQRWTVEALQSLVRQHEKPPGRLPSPPGASPPQ